MKQRAYKKLLNAVAFMMATVMLVSTTGCGKSEKQLSSAEGNSNSAKGRYVETEMKMPKGCSSPKLESFDDGSVAFVDISKGVLYSKESIEDSEWKAKEISKLHELIKQKQDIQVAASSKSGKVFVAYNNWDEADGNGTFPTHYMMIDVDGTTKELHLGDTEQIVKAVFADEETLYVGNSSGSVFRCNISTESCEKLFDTETKYVTELQLFENFLFIVDEKEAYYYDLKTNKVDEKDALISDFFVKSARDGGSKYCVDSSDSKSIYLISRDGIFHHKVGGSVMEKLVDGLMTNLSDLSIYPSSIYEKNGVIYIFYSDGTGYSYRFDASVSAEMEHQIEVYALEDSKTVRQAISVFRKEYPDTFVKFEIGMDTDSGVQKSDAITALNTKLLAGEGPDVLILDGLPMEQYQEKGILEDMSDIVATVGRKEKFFDGILKAYEKDGKICAIPSRAIIPMVVGDKDLVSRVRGTKSLANVSEKILSDKQVYATTMGTYTSEEALKMAYFGSTNAWKTSDGKIDEKKVREIIETAKIIYENDQKNLTENLKKEHEQVLKEMESYGIGAEQFLNGVGTQTDRVIGKYQYVGVVNLESMLDASNLFSAPRNETSVSVSKYNGDDKNFFVPGSVVGICSSSDDKKLASAFVKEMLSEDVQKIDTNDGFPVNKNAYEEFIIDSNPDVTIATGFTAANGEEVELAIDWPLKEELAQLKGWLEKASVPQNLDEDVKQIIIDNGKAAVSGEKDVETCVKEVVQKLSLYLAE